MEKQIDVCFQKGQIQLNDDCVKILSEHDAFSYFKKIKGTPKYWQTGKYDIYAMIEQFGPFHIFLTLSAGEKRWHHVVVAILEKDGFEITKLCGLWKWDERTKMIINKNGNLWKFSNDKWIKTPGDQEDTFQLRLKDNPTQLLAVELKANDDITSSLEVYLQSGDEPNKGTLWEFCDPDKDGWSVLRNLETGFLLTSSTTTTDESLGLTVEGKP